MAITNIDTSISLRNRYAGFMSGVFWTSSTTGYITYIDDTNDNLIVSKTTNSGTSWTAQDSGGTVSSGDVSSYPGLFRADAWFDKNTPGDTGTKIHIALCRRSATGTVNLLTYFNFDTSTDLFSSPVTIASTATAHANVSGGASISISKSKGGILFIGCYYNPDASLTGFWRSTSGSSWTSKTNTLTEAVNDDFKLFPGNMADTNDMWALYHDYSANELSLKTFDDSANSWETEASIATGITGDTSTVFYRPFQGAVRHSDGHLLAVAATEFDVSTADLKSFDITNRTSISTKTDVFSNADDWYYPSIFINRNNNDIYVPYIGKSDGTETITSTVNIYFRKSTDGMTSWGSETLYNSSVTDDYRVIGAMGGGTVGYFMPAAMNDDLNDLIVDTSNAVFIENTLYFQTIAGTIGTITGTPIKRANKPLTGTAGALSGTTIKSPRKIIAGSLGNLTGIINKRINKPLSGTLGSLSGILSSIKLSLVSVGGTLGSLSGDTVKQINKITAGVIGNLTGSAVKLVAVNISGVIGVISGTLSGIKISLVSVGGSLGSLSGSLVNQTNKILLGQLGNISGDIIKTTSKIIGGTLGVLSGSIYKVFIISIGGTIGTISGTVLKQINKIETGSLGSLSGNTIKQTNKIVNGTIGAITGTISGNIILFFTQAVGGTLGSLSGSIIKTTYKDFTGSISPIGALVQFKLIVVQKVRAGYNSITRSRTGTAVSKITRGGYDIIKRIR